MMITTHIIILSLSFFEIVFAIGSQLTVGDLGDINGTVQYTEWNNRTVFAFKGIPYAKPPIDDLRFRPPVKIDRWNGTLNATSHGPACPQSSSNIVYSEDCLTLNVFVPEINNTKKNTTLLPVLIFIHGGTFRTGSASNFEPIRLLDGDDLIIVVPQYRLGFLGLFSLLTDDVPGNVQFLDQIMAMQWVQDNIKYFGGDKDKVTLYGQSSGSASVHFHILSPLTKGLFHRTILQSGSALRTYGIDKHPLESASILANYCGCKNIKDADKITDCMKSMTVDEIINCTSNYLSETALDGLTRAIGHMAVVQTEGDQKFLTADPTELIARGEFMKLPMMGGVLKNDGCLYIQSIYDILLHPYGLVNDTNFMRYNLIAYTLKYLGISDITNGIMHTMMRTYFTEDEIGNLTSMIPGLIDISTLISYKSGSYETLRANSLFQDTYLYQFEYRVHDPNSEHPLYPFDIGVNHGDDIGLLFPFKSYQKETDIDMAKMLVKLWTSFIIDGVPSADGVTWPAMSSSVGPYLVIDSEPKVKKDFLKEFVTVNKN